MARNQAAASSLGNVLIQASDNTFLQKGWDPHLMDVWLLARLHPELELSYYRLFSAIARRFPVNWPEYSQLRMKVPLFLLVRVL